MFFKAVNLSNGHLILWPYNLGLINTAGGKSFREEVLILAGAKLSYKKVILKLYY